MKTVNHYIKYYNLDTKITDYSKSFVNNKLKIIWLDNMFCTIHEQFFNKPVAKVAEGSLCPKCGRERSKQKRTQFNFKDKAYKVHGDLYDYSLVNYINNKTKVKIKCENGHIFEQVPNDHLRGNGCIFCSKELNSNFDYVNRCKSWNRLEANLYLINIFNENESFLKIGITVDINKRFYKLPYDYKIIKLIEGKVENIFNTEQELHKKFCNSTYKPSIYFSGITECYPLSLLEDIQQTIVSLGYK